MVQSHARLNRFPKSCKPTNLMSNASYICEMAQTYIPDRSNTATRLSPQTFRIESLLYEQVNFSFNAQIVKLKRLGAGRSGRLVYGFSGMAQPILKDIACRISNRSSSRARCSIELETASQDPPDIQGALQWKPRYIVLGLN